MLRYDIKEIDLHVIKVISWVKYSLWHLSRERTRY